MTSEYLRVKSIQAGVFLILACVLISFREHAVVEMARELRKTRGR